MKNKHKWLTAIIAIVSAVTGLGMTSCNNGSSPTITYYTLNFDKGDIEFRSETNAFTKDERDAIIAEINKLTPADFEEFAGYVAKWTFQRNVPGGRSITLDADNKAIIVSNALTVDGILADFAAGKAAAIAAREAEYLAGIEPDPTNIPRDGINFHIAGGVFTRAEIAALQAQILAAGTLTAFADFINQITIERGDNAGSHSLTGTGAETKANVTIGHNALTSSITAALEAAQTAVEDARPHQDNIAFINGVDIRVPASAGLTLEQITDLIERLTTALNRDDVVNNANRGDLKIIEITGIMDENAQLSNYAGGIIRGTIHSSNPLGIAIRTRLNEGWAGFAYAHDANVIFLADMGRDNQRG